MSQPVLMSQVGTDPRRLPPTTFNGDPLPEFILPGFALPESAVPAPVGQSGAVGQSGELLFHGYDAPPLPAPDASLYETPIVFESEKISDYKDGFFQKLEFIGTWLPRSGDNALGWSRFDLRLGLALPAPSKEWPLMITPGFTAYYTDGPVATDIPSRMYEATLQLLWLPKLTERTRLILSVTPGAYGDFEQTDGRGYRTTGVAAVAYDWVPGRIKVVGGVVYLDRDDFNILPAVGVIWTPRDNLEIEAVLPRPRAGWRWNCGPAFEDWVYVAGEIGGGTWQIERADLTGDRMTLRDFRLVLGMERKRDGGAGYRFEVGYVFARRIEFRADPRTFELSDGLMLRAGFAF